MRRSLITLLVVMVLVTAFSPMPAEAVGSATISGSAYTTGLWFYYTSRNVTNPTTPGPEVAFNLSTKMPSTMRLFLGTHNCNGSTSGAIYEQFYGAWRPVQFYSAPTSFCMMTYAVNASGTFAGDLAWD